MLIEWLHRHSRKVLSVCLLSILMVGGLYTLWLPKEFRYFDELNYDHLARNLAETGKITFDGSHLTAWRPPAYPFVLSILYRMGGSLQAGRFLNILFLMGSAFFCYRIARRFSPVAAAFASIFVALYPLFYYTAGTLYPQTMGMFLMLLTLDFLFSLRDSWKKCFFLALGTSLLMLTVPSFVVIIGVILGDYVFRKPARWGSAFLYLAFVCLCMAPWTVRNYLLFHQFVFVATNGGVNLYVGNSPETTPTKGVQTLDQALVISQEANEAQVDDYYRNYAFDYILQHKWHSILLYLGKLLHYFDYKNTLATEGEAHQWYWILSALTYYPLVIGVFLRLCWFNNPSITWEEKICLYLYALSALFAAIFFTRIRFRVPYDSLLIIVNGILISVFLQSPLSKKIVRS